MTDYSDLWCRLPLRGKVIMSSTLYQGKACPTRIAPMPDIVTAHTASRRDSHLQDHGYIKSNAMPTASTTSLKLLPSQKAKTNHRPTNFHSSQNSHSRTICKISITRTPLFGQDRICMKMETHLGIPKKSSVKQRLSQMPHLRVVLRMGPRMRNRRTLPAPSMSAASAL